MKHTFKNTGTKLSLAGSRKKYWIKERQIGFPLVELAFITGWWKHMNCVDSLTWFCLCVSWLSKEEKAFLAWLTCSGHSFFPHYLACVYVSVDKGRKVPISPFQGSTVSLPSVHSNVAFVGKLRVLRLSNSNLTLCLCVFNACLYWCTSEMSCLQYCSTVLAEALGNTSNHLKRQQKESSRGHHHATIILSVQEGMLNKTHCYCNLIKAGVVVYL